MQQIMHRLSGHLPLLDQVQNDGWVKSTAARAHHQTIECRKAHSGGGALPRIHCAQVGTAAQMRHNRTTPGAWPVTRAQRRRDMIVRQAVKAVGHNAIVAKVTRQSIKTVEFWAVGMKCCIERANLEGRRQMIPRPCHHFQIGGLMHRRERGKVIKIINNGSRQNGRMDEVLPTMHNPVADRSDRPGQAAPGQFVKKSFHWRHRVILAHCRATGQFRPLLGRARSIWARNLVKKSALAAGREALRSAHKPRT